MHSGPNPRAEENATTCPGEKSHGSAWGPFLRAWLCAEGPPEAVLGAGPHDDLQGGHAFRQRRNRTAAALPSQLICQLKINHRGRQEYSGDDNTW